MNSSLDVEAAHGGIIVGYAGRGNNSLNVEAGASVHAENITIGRNVGSKGTMTVSGGTDVTNVSLSGENGAGVGATLIVGASGSGKLNIYRALVEALGR